MKIKIFKNAVVGKIKNRRVCLYDRKDGAIDLVFKTLDNNYTGPDAYGLHLVKRGKIVFNVSAISHEGADTLFHCLAEKLGYDVVKLEEGKCCPICNSKKTYTTTAIHCRWCSMTTEL